MLGRSYQPDGGPSGEEEDLRGLVDLLERRRVIEPGERKMIHSVFELGDTIAREVMVPRTDMIFVQSGKTLRQALSLALRSGFSRIPVVGENLDDVIGIAYLKDIVTRTSRGHGRKGHGRSRVPAGPVGHAPGHVRAGQQAGR